jgi:hypothetical protein
MPISKCKLYRLIFLSRFELYWLRNEMRSFVIGNLYEEERVDFKRGRNLGGQ